jgi:type VI secretion system protein ImpB
MVDITFESLDDFAPDAVARKVEALRKLLEARTQLKELLAFMDGKDKAQDLIAEAIKNPALLQSLASVSKPETKE